MLDVLLEEVAVEPKAVVTSTSMQDFKDPSVAYWKMASNEISIPQHGVSRDQQRKTCHAGGCHHGLAQVTPGHCRGR